MALHFSHIAHFLESPLASLSLRNSPTHKEYFFKIWSSFISPKTSLDSHGFRGASSISMESEAASVTTSSALISSFFSFFFATSSISPCDPPGWPCLKLSHGKLGGWHSKVKSWVSPTSGCNSPVLKISFFEIYYSGTLLRHCNSQSITAFYSNTKFKNYHSLVSTVFPRK